MIYTCRRYWVFVWLAIGIAQGASLGKENGRFSGTVLEVRGADILSLWAKGRETHVHLYGIECPRKGTPLYKKACVFTSDKILSKMVHIAEMGKEVDNTIQGMVYLDSDTSVNAQLVKAGLACLSAENFPEEPMMSILQRNAQLAKRGIWGEKRSLAKTKLGKSQ